MAGPIRLPPMWALRGHCGWWYINAISGALWPATKSMNRVPVWVMNTDTVSAPEVAVT